MLFLCFFSKKLEFTIDKKNYSCIIVLVADEQRKYGCLAQLVEHSLDVRVVRDSSSLTSTKKARV